MANRTKGLMKVGALILAIFLWFYVSIEQNPFVERQFSVPVTLENVPEGLEATPAQKNVNVLVRNRQDRISSLHPGSFTATIDLSNASLGQSTYPVQVRSTDPMLRSLRVVPKEMTVTLVQGSGISVPLEVKTSGQAPADVQLGQIELSSDLVYISGPEDILLRVHGASVAVDLTNLRETTVSSEKVEIYDVNGQALPLDGVTINPSHILVTIPVDSQLVEKTVPVQATTVGQPAEGYYLTQASADPEEIVILGEEAVLAEVDRVETMPIDISGGSQDRTESVRLNLPDQVSVRGLTQVDVQLQFGSDPDAGALEVELPIQFTGQAAAGTPSFEGVDQVQVTYLADVSPQEVQGLLQAFVDVSGLEAGRHELAVTIQSESEDRLQVERMTPTTVTVLIE